MHTALLGVLCHDLLAPITAIKWQTELLGKKKQDEKKQEKYIQGIRDSAEIAISILQYVASTDAVLRGEHSSSVVEARLSEVLKEAWKHVEPQYARHGVALDLSFDEMSAAHRVDVQMMRVFVWVIAKFFLTSALAQEAVQVRGLFVPSEDGTDGRYIMTISAKNIAHRAYYQKVFTDPTVAIEDAEGAFHSNVFAGLIRAIAKEAEVLFSAGTEVDVFTFEVSFTLEK